MRNIELLQKVHDHKYNKNVLDKLSDNNGTLMYDNNPILGFNKNEEFIELETENKTIIASINEVNTKANNAGLEALNIKYENFNDPSISNVSEALDYLISESISNKKLMIDILNRMLEV